jgi:hypothetical protein
MLDAPAAKLEVRSDSHMNQFQTPVGFKSGSWKKRQSARFFLINLKLLF